MGQPGFELPVRHASTGSSRNIPIGNRTENSHTPPGSASTSKTPCPGAKHLPNTVFLPSEVWEKTREVFHPEGVLETLKTRLGRLNGVGEGFRPCWAPENGSRSTCPLRGVELGAWESRDPLGQPPGCWGHRIRQSSGPQLIPCCVIWELTGRPGRKGSASLMGLTAPPNPQLLYPQGTKSAPFTSLPPGKGCLGAYPATVASTQLAGELWGCRETQGAWVGSPCLSRGGTHSVGSVWGCRSAPAKESLSSPCG